MKLHRLKRTSLPADTGEVRHRFPPEVQVEEETMAITSTVEGTRARAATIKSEVRL